MSLLRRLTSRGLHSKRCFALAPDRRAPSAVFRCSWCSGQALLCSSSSSSSSSRPPRTTSQRPSPFTTRCAISIPITHQLSPPSQQASKPASQRASLPAFQLGASAPHRTAADSLSFYHDSSDPFPPSLFIASFLAPAHSHPGSPFPVRLGTGTALASHLG